MDRYHFNAEILLVHLAKFAVGSRISLPILFILVVMKPGSSCCKLPLEAPEEGKKEDTGNEEMPAAKEISMEAVIARVLSELAGIFALKGAQNAFMVEKIFLLCS